MADDRTDQAAGLRRLFRSPSIPVVTVVGVADGCGATTVSTALAVHLAEHGNRVCLVDEHRDVRSATSVLGARSRYDLLQAVEGHVAPTQVPVQLGPNLDVIPAARLAQRRGPLPDHQLARLDQYWSEIVGAADLAIVDSAARIASESSILGSRAGWILLVCGTGVRALQGACVSLQHLAGATESNRVGLLVNAATDAGQATSVAQGLAYVSDRRGGARPQYLGWLPRIGGLRTRETPWQRLAWNPSVSAVAQWINPGIRTEATKAADIEEVPALGTGEPGSAAFRWAAQGGG